MFSNHPLPVSIGLLSKQAIQSVGRLTLGKKKGGEEPERQSDVVWKH